MSALHLSIVACLVVQISGSGFNLINLFNLINAGQSDQALEQQGTSQSARTFIYLQIVLKTSDIS